MQYKGKNMKSREELEEKAINDNEKWVEDLICKAMQYGNRVVVINKEKIRKEVFDRFPEWITVEETVDLSRVPSYVLKW
jgi:predicted glycosyltransferase